jgi:F0F1-type ATP synthase assembly protein I
VEGCIANRTKPLWLAAAEASSIGIEMAVCLGGGYYIGSRLDRHFHTSPWLTVVFFLIGVGACIKAMVRVARDYKRENAQGNDQQPGGPPKP